MSTVWLVGVMGVGKTEAGRRAAAALEVPFVDTDSMVETEAGSSISSIWRAEGEERFRSLESAAMARAARSNGVVATGGGAVLTEENRALMKGTVVWLTARPETISGRIGAGGRPLLEGTEITDRMRRLIDERAVFYEKVATHTLATVELDAAGVASRIVELVAG